MRVSPLLTRIAILALALVLRAPAALAQPAAGAQPPPPAGAPAPPPGSQPPAGQPPAVGAPASGDATTQPATPVVAPAVLKIAGAAGLVLHPILPAATADFELVMSRFFDAVAKVGDDAQKAIVSGWKVVRVAEGAPGGVNALYAFLVDPVVAEADYSATFILEMIYKAFPADAPDLHRKFVAAYAGPRHLLTLTPVLPAPVAPAVVPPAPK